VIYTRFSIICGELKRNIDTSHSVVQWVEEGTREEEGVSSNPTGHEAVDFARKIPRLAGFFFNFNTFSNLILNLTLSVFF
jgi:hypothetical protein